VIISNIISNTLINCRTNFFLIINTGINKSSLNLCKTGNKSKLYWVSHEHFKIYIKLLFSCPRTVLRRFHTPVNYIISSMEIHIIYIYQHMRVNLYKFCININSPIYFSDKSPYSGIDVHNKGIYGHMYYTVLYCLLSLVMI
jgi:hypothetical protein